MEMKMFEFMAGAICGGAIIAALIILFWVVKIDVEADFNGYERNLHIKHLERMDKKEK